MHTRLILPGEIVDVLSEDHKHPESQQLAGCRNITYIAQNTNRHGIIFWDQPTANTHTIQAFIADSQTDFTYYHQIKHESNHHNASLLFNYIHDYLRKELGVIHHIRAKIVRDHSLDTGNMLNASPTEEACSIITQINTQPSQQITSYVRELHYNNRFLVAVTALPIELTQKEQFSQISSSPLKNVRIKLMEGSKSQAATYAMKLAKEYQDNTN